MDSFYPNKQNSSFQGSAVNGKIAKPQTSLTKSFMNFLYMNTNQSSTNTTYKLDDVFTSKVQLTAKRPTLYLLGKKYVFKKTAIKVAGKPSLSEAEFMEHFKQIIWFSYRQSIPFIENDTLSLISDAGWGCLVRVAQMIMAQCILRHYWGEEQKPSADVQMFIISLFSDFETDPGISPYSIQQIIRRGRQEDYNVQLGDWYTGPKIMSLMEDLHEDYACKLFGNLKIVNFYEQCIMEDQIFELQKQLRQSIYGHQPEERKENWASDGYTKDFEWQYSLLIIVHTRLGIDRISPVYQDQMQILMQLKQFVGVIGGKSNKAYYILGFQDDYCLYIDPHYVKECLHSREDENQRHTEYFPDQPKVLSMANLSPSLGFCFYIRNEQEYYQFKKEVVDYFKHCPESLFSIYNGETEINYMEQAHQEQEDQKLYDGDFEII